MAIKFDELVTKAFQKYVHFVGNIVNTTNYEFTFGTSIPQ